MIDLVTIITLNYNKSNYTIKCIESVLNSDYSNFKIVLVDNGSEQIEYDKLSQINDDRLIIKRLEKNKGYVGGINYGLEISQEYKPGFYLIMNNDTIIEKHAIKELVNTALKYESNCIVSGKVYNMDEPDTLQYIGQWCQNYNKLEFPSYIKNSKEKDVGQFDKEMKMEMLDDVFWLLPNNAFQKIGYYSNYFFLYGEQNDYALRARKLGIKLIFTPKAKIWHYHHLTTADDDKGLKKIYYWQAYAILLLAYLHLSQKYFFLLYFSKLLKLITVGIAYLVLFKFVKFKQNHVPKVLAHYYFTLWLLHKKENIGFNPFINKKND